MKIRVHQSLWAATLSVILANAVSADSLRDRALDAMARATRFFRSEIATEGGYLWSYREDLSSRRGERRATASQIWIQPPGTPAVELRHGTGVGAPFRAPGGNGG